MRNQLESNKPGANLIPISYSGNMTNNYLNARCEALAWSRTAAIRDPDVVSFLCEENLFSAEILISMVIALPAYSLSAALSYYITRLPLDFQNYQQVHEKPYLATRCPHDKGGRTWSSVGIQTESLPRLDLVDFSGVLFILLLFSVVAKMYTSREKALKAAHNAKCGIAHGSSLVRAHKASCAAFVASSTNETEVTKRPPNGPAAAAASGPPPDQSAGADGKAPTVLTMQEPQDAVEGLRREMAEMMAVLLQEVAHVKRALAYSGTHTTIATAPVLSPDDVWPVLPE